MRFKPEGSDVFYTLVKWDFNDPQEAPVLFVDDDGNSAIGTVEIDMETWKDGDTKD